MMRIVCAAMVFAGAAATCPPKGFDSIQSFDLDAYAAKRWYIQQQMPVAYLPKTQNFCVYAEYVKRTKKSFWGYDIDVHNYAQEADGTAHDSGEKIKAKIVDEKTGKFEVGFFALPTFLSGPYWIIDYNEAEGYALVSGGSPTKDGANGLCQTGASVNDAGLWIFTREQKRDEQLVQKVRGIAESKGFDLSVLNDVDQSNCKSGEDNIVV